MSFWAKIETKIKDLRTFEKVCKKNGVTCDHKGKNINLVMNGSTVGYLTPADKGSWSLNVDNDPKYSQFTAKFGKNGGTVMRDYAESVIRTQMVANGGSVVSSRVQQDGSVVMRVQRA